MSFRWPLESHHFAHRDRSHGSGVLACRFALPSRGSERDGEFLKHQLPADFHLVGNTRHRRSEIVETLVHKRERRCASRDGAQGDCEQRVVYRPRRSLGPDESPSEHDALTEYELDDFAR